MKNRFLLCLTSITPFCLWNALAPLIMCNSSLDKNELVEVYLLSFMKPIQKPCERGLLNSLFQRVEFTISPRLIHYFSTLK